MRRIGAITALSLPVLLSLLYSCGTGGSASKEEILSKKEHNPEPNIPLECYTDTGVVKLGKAIANPCYVCHTKALTPYENEVDDFDLQLVYDFPEEIKEMGNPWLNAIKPELTIGSVPMPSDEEIKTWIRQDNWSKAYAEKGKGELVYFPDIPPIYKYENGSYELINVDKEGFVRDPETGEYTGWRVFKWKPFPGFFPTNGRIDSTFIRLPEKFRKKNGEFDLNLYKKNLAILECAMKGVAPGETCSGTEVGDFIMPFRYEGDASDVEVVVYQYPPGTEFAHPLYYLDPENTLSFKSLRIKEMRYMKKLAYADTRTGTGEEEEEEGTFFWDKGRFFNDSGYWEMRAFIEDKNGYLRPQSPEESKFCIACHGGIGGTVDGTFTLWRKIPGEEGWKEQDYKNIKDYRYKAITCENLDSLEMGEEVKKALEAYCSKVGESPGEYTVYFALTAGGDHFRSNYEILQDISVDGKVDLELLYNPEKIKFIDNSGFIKPELFFPEPERAYGIDKQYYRIVKAQAFIYGRDVFEKAFGISSGGNSLEELDNLESTGVKESGIWNFVKNFLSSE
ncbi:hypothetical protein [Aquifex aeolicus]|uniref:Uncharacterized lipoprotein aq_1262 n=1 Tax=Aquifex aeolicus (strain VF5) TaxID=224324 RepID=Y1262_AQUAE|nr:hypothetical protein [Aquifex aeolicus]O67301.1 RecName: Full=Uncharacterized lipoprotein aq_1262; Flags: Precursor [Aquifex aeolicus VF5]AAC07263.1 putative protein [Aquifex aeolicus VF5]